MAEILDYAPDLRAITGGRGDYTMELERYEEIPGHLSQKVIDAARAEDEASEPSRPDAGLPEPPGAVATVPPMVDLNGEPGACVICERSMLAGERTRDVPHPRPRVRARSATSASSAPRARAGSPPSSPARSGSTRTASPGARSGGCSAARGRAPRRAPQSARRRRPSESPSRRARRGASLARVTGRSRSPAPSRRVRAWSVRRGRVNARRRSRRRGGAACRRTRSADPPRVRELQRELRTGARSAG